MTRSYSSRRSQLGRVREKTLVLTGKATGLELPAVLAETRLTLRRSDAMRGSSR